MVTDRLNPLYRIRRQEIELVLDELCIQKGTRILEIGCGSGIQSTFLSEKSDFVVSSDIELKDVKFGKLCLIRCSGEYLPFKNGAFDVVYSSNVLEHIKDRNLALRETRRVLGGEQTFVCVVPTSTWKILDIIMHYFRIIRGIINRMNREKQVLVMETKRPSGISLKKIRYLTPKVHGEYKKNAEEIIAYQERNWVHLLEIGNFNVYKTKNLLLYAPLGDLRKRNITLLPPFLRLERITGLCSSVALFANSKSDLPTRKLIKGFS
jgi:SAM-dependent methyltransferase